MTNKPNKKLIKKKNKISKKKKYKLSSKKKHKLKHNKVSKKKGGNLNNNNNNFSKILKDENLDDEIFKKNLEELDTHLKTFAFENLREVKEETNMLGICWQKFCIYKKTIKKSKNFTPKQKHTLLKLIDYYITDLKSKKERYEYCDFMHETKYKIAFNDILSLIVDFKKKNKEFLKQIDEKKNLIFYMILFELIYNKEELKGFPKMTKEYDEYTFKKDLEEAVNSFLNGQYQKFIIFLEKNIHFIYKNKVKIKLVQASIYRNNISRVGQYINSLIFPTVRWANNGNNENLTKVRKYVKGSPILNSRGNPII